MLAAPLLAGNDVRSMNEQTRDILTNRDVIAVDQDPLVVQGRPLAADGRVIVKPLAGGAVAVALFNPDAGPVAIRTDARALGLSAADCFSDRDLWTHTDSTTDGRSSSRRYLATASRCCGSRRVAGDASVGVQRLVERDAGAVALDDLDRAGQRVAAEQQVVRTRELAWP